MLMIVAEPASAVPAEDDACQQAARIRPEDHRLTVEVLGRPGFDCLLASHEQIFVDDLQMVKRLGLHSLHVVDADVDRILNDRPDACPAPESSSVFCLDPFSIQVLCDPVCAVTVIGQQVKDLSDDDRFIFVNDQIPHLLILFVCAALMLQLVAVRNMSSPVQPLLHHLRVLCFHTNGSLLAFAGSLPEADVVQELIDVVIEALLAFSGAPNLDALLNEPLHNEGCFIIPPADAVEHENQQHVELVHDGSLLNLHDGITVIGADLVTGDAFFGNLINNLPVRVGRRIFAASQLLHGDVIMIHLADG